MKHPLHPRLERLNRELRAEKDFDYINIVGKGWRFRVCVMRDADGKFFATTTLKKAYRVQGSSPASAVKLLMVDIKRDLNWMRYAEKEAVRMAQAGV